MKKLLVIVSLAFVGMVAQAQLYMGGSFSMNSSTSSNSDGDKLTTTFGVNLHPEFGYYLTDRCDIGASATLGYSGTRYHTTDTKTESTNWRFSPFIRYAFIRLGNFDIIERTYVFVGGNKNVSGTKTFNAGTGITPILAYNLNERLTFQTELNFASIEFSYNKTKNGGSETKAKIGFDSDKLVNIGGITIGFRYKF